jgi:purine catabolism regulator
VPLTLAALLHRPELGLQLRLGQPALEVTWVHISDLADPSPYLQPGCMLLTTGLSFEPETHGWPDYVARIKRAGVPAIGFGVGLRHARIPARLLATAGEQDLAVIEVPERTTFSQVMQAVVEIGARDDRLRHAEELRRHRELLVAASKLPAQRSLVHQLAEQLDAWVLLLGRDGQYLAGSARARLHTHRVQTERAPAVIRYEDGLERVTVLPIDGSARPSGWLAVGRATALAPGDRSIVDATAALLRLDVARAAELLDAERRERRAVLDLVLAGERSMAASVAASLGVGLPEGPVRVVLIEGSVPALLEQLESARALRLGSALTAATADSSVLACVQAQDSAIEAVRTAVAGVPEARGVISEVVPFDQAGRALGRISTLLPSSGVVFAEDLSSQRLVNLLDSEAVRGWASRVLAPLRPERTDRVDLLETVRTYLANNGNNEAAATALGIHRRTLGYRLGKAEQLLGRSLADPNTRAELWIAITTPQSAQ